MLNRRRSNLRAVNLAALTAELMATISALLGVQGDPETVGNWRIPGELSPVS